MAYFCVGFIVIILWILDSNLIYGCPPPRSIKPCLCTSERLGNNEKPRWVNVTCSFARSWTQIRDALQPFRRKTKFWIQSLHIGKIWNNAGRLNGVFRHVQLAEVIITDSNLLVTKNRVPKGAFKNASWITSLHLHNVQLKSVPTIALRHLAILRELSLAQNLISSILPRSFHVQSNSLKFLDLQRNELNEVPSGALRDLPNLEILLLNGNRIYQILGDSFVGTPNLEALELSDNELIFLHDNAFNGLYHLKHLGVAGNPLFSGAYSAFQKLPCLEGLFSLDVSATAVDLKNHQWPGNTKQNLTSLVVQQHFNPISFDLLASYASLSDLDLKGNVHLDPLQFVFPRTLNSVRRLDATETSLSVDQLRAFPYLETVYMNSNRVRKLMQIHLTPLRSLAILHLSDCSVSRVEMSAFWHLRWSIKEIHLSHNRLRRLKRRTFHQLSVLTMLDLSYNRFRDYNRGGVLTDDKKPVFPLDKRFFDRQSAASLRTLLLAGNGLRRVPENCIKPLNRLQDLDLSGNRIENVQLQFRWTINLENLNLRNNKISYIHPDAFRNLVKLQMLDLSWNQITTINSIIFPPNLEEVYVARCYLKTFNNPSIGTLKKLRNVDLSYNIIETLSADTFEMAGNTLIYLDLAMNPLNCDCSLQPFVDWLSTNDAIISPDTRCYWPMELRYIRPMIASVCWSTCDTTTMQTIGKDKNDFTKTCSRTLSGNDTFLY